jgi:collagenase-like PrtC family protease
LVQYAHLYHAQVFVVINTILYDNELETWATSYCVTCQYPSQ